MSETTDVVVGSVQPVYDCRACQDEGCLLCGRPVTKRLRSAHPDNLPGEKYGPCAPDCEACRLEQQIGVEIDFTEHWPACTGCQRLLTTLHGLVEDMVKRWGGRVP